MEDVVAIKVVDDERGTIGFLTWGRLWSAVDETKLLEVVRANLAIFGLHTPREVVVCSSLREVESSEYFYEGILHFAWSPPPFGRKYEDWKKQKRRDVKSGREIYCLGALKDLGNSGTSGISHGRGWKPG